MRPMVDTNQPGTTLTHSGELSPYGTSGLRGGSHILVGQMIIKGSLFWLV